MTVAHALHRPLPRPSPEAVGVLAGLSAVAMWGAYLAFARAGVLGGLGPFDFVALRYGTAGAIMLGWLAWSGGSPRDLGGAGWARGAALALAAGPVFVVLGVGGYAFAPLSHGAVIQPATLTVGGALLAWALLGERPSRAGAVGAAVIVAGALVIARPGGAGAGAWLGDAMFVGAGLMFVAFTLMVRRWGVAPMPATAAVSIVSALVAVPAYLVWGEPARLLALPPATLLAQVVVQGVLSGVLAVAAFALAVRRLGAGRAALFPALVPAATLLIGVPVTGEVPGALDGAGMALASAGLLIAVGVLRPPRRRP